MRSELLRPPRNSPSASTRMLFPAPVSPVMTVSPAPKGSSISSISANPEMRKSVNIVDAPVLGRGPPQFPSNSSLTLAPRQFLSEDGEEGRRGAERAQRSIGLAYLDGIARSEL